MLSNSAADPVGPGVRSPIEILRPAFIDSWARRLDIQRAAAAAAAESSQGAGDTFPADAAAGDTPAAEGALPTVLSSRVLYTGKVVTLRVDEIALPGAGLPSARWSAILERSW